MNIYKSSIVIIILLLALPQVSVSAVSAASAPAASLSDLVAMMSEKTDGKKPGKIKVTLADKSKLVSYKSHSDQALTVHYRKKDIDLQWSDMPSEEALSVAEKFKLNAQDYVLLAKYSLSEGLERKVKKYCSSALRKDANVKADTKVILAALKSGSAQGSSSSDGGGTSTSTSTSPRTCTSARTASTRTSTRSAGT